MEAVDLGTENDERMARLREALVLGIGFQLVIVQVEPGEQREEVVRRLSGWSGHNGVPRLELVHLASGDSPVMRMARDHAGVILVGLEVGDDDKDERFRELLGELNWSRDRLPELVHGPLVLVVSQRVQTALFEQAPDFYSWRAHSTSIAVRQPEISHPTAQPERQPEDPAVLEAMIAQAASLRPPVIRELAHLHTRLAFTRAVRAEIAEAEAALETAYDGYVRAGNTDDRVGLLILRSAIADGRGRVDEAAAWLERARQEAASGTPSPEAAARLLSASALLALDRDEPPSAEAELQRAVSAFMALGAHAKELARLVSAQASLSFRRGKVEASVTLLEQALELSRRAGDPAEESNTLMMLAGAAGVAGRSDDAERYGVAAVARAEASASADLVVQSRAALGRIALLNNHVELAGEVLGHEVTAADPDSNGMLAEARAYLALHRGDQTTAAHYLHAALESYQRRGGRTRDMATVALELAKLGRRIENWTLALTSFETAESLGDPRQRAVAALGLAELAFARGERSAELADQFASTTQVLVDIGDATLADTAREYRGAVLLALDRDMEAREVLETARSGFETRGQAENATRVQGLLARLEGRGQAT